MTGILDGKTVLITGIITDASIAFHAAAVAQEQGAKVIITGIPERLRLIDRIAKRLPQEVPAAIPLDITNEEDLAALAGRITELAPEGVDGVVHSIAFAPKTLMGPDAVPFLEGPGPDVAKSFEISAWSYAALARAVLPVMNEGGSIVGMDFDPRTAMPDYNWMGVSKAALESVNRYVAREVGNAKRIRSNLVAAGPIKTLAAKAISGTATDDARKLTMLNEYWDGASPIGWNVDDPTVVGKSVVALLSDWLPGTTGSIVYVDGGASHNTWFPDNFLG
ncbi:NADH-dependent enoyl-ACP reductase InhA [Gordonia sp. (in: high G+C Gram-positive bacteria)]|jgi:enoyl ACP reductase|uniref:NADH-dependent enoyl-ACP reductase InhA n=1 Tax=Gordonia sp. (in: high G+C Gram-positive bacteria) TaxID=84139 RepID=UPI001E16A4CD|nr:NADH-dependent enoyl-ACP reductase InhA [Gordonia sp. (in: high G+C Gram-positive bacteria)]MCB1294302.1 enoyl-ACP reductase FabI [Gordonia sp. (in: high G+C Gram-positive bacteria)]HMS76901.1 NADH-dependent enoyl-ACP reductase InhA [Gordonia sp. (in: high G+C Gram-positive bacteria)]HQV19041.1 NADH-dependent enoyl-ACP reductase InhA [Gordonia sp. (in: high G+C Gram-positive bacteria)]